MNILFDSRGRAIPPKKIKTCISEFGKSYTKTVRNMTARSETALTQDIFFQNVAQLMPNFKMTRRGCFNGIKFKHGIVYDPNGQILACWAAGGKEVIQIKNYLLQQADVHRRRIIADIPDELRKHVVADLGKAFKKLVPICIGNVSNGFVAASKILFAVLPEISLPVDTAQWRKLSKTVVYGDIINLMINEIKAWENQTNQHLDLCDSCPDTTLPAIYNVMAMKARP